MVRIFDLTMDIGSKSYSNLRKRGNNSFLMKPPLFRAAINLILICFRS
ncbi:hypothetical protein LEP1GSC058_0958 [Leptospira fainei serovar Hurstbridge str. BUT 6]|uniref:Uncharacterized protein n=1 Tax=Leptospira fainei serovar Hurstbridge str. BUT 6 TaxID=1193011 RepID=S3UQJ0_9LEPT|nr:hypothetical protein LEP1GSC058_0958 [Leptospira fainei serovar Hurstbridge str. BUT 6]